jgi:hypothetical protein
MLFIDSKGHASVPAIGLLCRPLLTSLHAGASLLNGAVGVLEESGSPLSSSAS